MSQRHCAPLRQEPQCVGEREKEAAGRVNTMDQVFCVDCWQKLTGQYCWKCGRDYGATAATQREGEGRSDGCRVYDEGGLGGGNEDMQEPEDDDDSEEDEEGVEEEGLPSSSEDDEDHLVQLLVPGKRTRTPNTLFFNDNFA